MKKFSILFLIFANICASNQAQKLDLVQDKAYHAFHEALQPHIGVNDLRNLVAHYIGCTLKHRRTLQFPERAFYKYGYFLSPDGNYIAHFDDDDRPAHCTKIVVHDMAKDKVTTKTIAGHWSSMRFIDPGKLVMIGNAQLKIWSVPELECINTRLFSDAIDRVDIGPGNDMISVWLRGDMGKRPVRLVDKKNMIPDSAIDLDWPGKYSRHRISASHGRSCFLSTQETTRSIVCFYDLEKSKKLKEITIKSKEVLKMVVHPKEKSVLLITRDHDNTYSRAGTLWYPDEDRQICNDTDFALGFDIAFTPNGLYLVAAQRGQQALYVYDSKNFERIACVPVGSNKIRFLDALTDQPVLFFDADLSQKLVWDICLDLQTQEKPITVQFIGEQRNKFRTYAIFGLLSALVCKLILDYSDAGKFFTLREFNK